jgi:hypothetical protein
LPAALFVGLRTVHALRGVFHRLGRIESAFLRRRLRRMTVDRPIYICGVPRCGTSVTLEMLSQHPTVASHRYADMVMPYLPYAWNVLTKHVGFLVKDEPRERLHQDRLMMTNFSPESAEELLWLLYFDNLHSEERSCVLRAEDLLPQFDRFYTDALKKLLLARGRSRYLSKANYNVTRLGYLHRLFPDARFLLFVRHPTHHIASLMKQDRLLYRLAEESPRTVQMTCLTAHFDFGPSRKWDRIVADPAPLRRLYERGEQVLAWARHWSSVYDFVHAQLAESSTLAERTLVVRYEDLCRSPAATVDRILAHCELDPSAFTATREHYMSKLSEPTYYRPTFSPEELRKIDEATEATRVRYGYSETAQEALPTMPVAV